MDGELLMQRHDEERNITRSIWLAALAALLVIELLGGCDRVLGKEQNPDYCPAHPDDIRCGTTPQDAPIDVRSGCTSNAECVAPDGVCVISSGACVECTSSEAGACLGATPVCGSDDACRGCTSHAECLSKACLPDGSCADGSNVAYVDPGGSDNANCTIQMPCTKVAKALATNRPYVKFHGTTDEGVTVNGGRTVTFLADAGAVLTRSSGTAIVTVSDNSTNLSIFDLALNNAPNNAGGYGLVVPTASGAPSVKLTRVTVLNDPGGGISVSGGSLTVTQSTIATNTGGGISINNAQFAITNSVVASNGAGASGVGGVKIDGITTTGTHQFDFNTITANLGPATLNTGVLCGTVVVPLLFDSNIIYGNLVSGGGTQIGGSAMCSTTYSDIGPDSSSGVGNINADPAFVNVAQSNYHITGGSPCKDTADTVSTVIVDIDGDVRPQGARRDMGADEYKP